LQFATAMLEATQYIMMETAIRCGPRRLSDRNANDASLMFEDPSETFVRHCIALGRLESFSIFLLFYDGPFIKADVDAVRSMAAELREVNGIIDRHELPIRRDFPPDTIAGRYFSLASCIEAVVALSFSDRVANHRERMQERYSMEGR
jgi:hypothetical protein